MAQLEVGIGANPKGLQKGIKTAVSAIDVLQKKNEELQASLKKNVTNSVKVSSSIAKISKQFKDGAISSKSFKSQLSKLNTTEYNLSNQNKKLSASLSQVNKQTNQLGGNKGMGKLAKGAANGSSAMTAFSRTVQDAPFGIMGVSNNITNLTEQFGYLKKRTGSTGGALKAMLKDLKGFGGITLAISLVTSLMLVFGDTLFKTKDKAKALKEEQERLTNALSDYVNGLEAVEQASLKGVKSAQKESISLRLLRGQAEDVNTSMNDRVKAVNELQRIYPTYLGNVSKEKILNGEVTTTFNTLTISILKRAKATASLNQIVKNSEKLLTLESQQSAKNQELDKKKQDFIKKYGKTYSDVMKNVGGEISSVNALTSPLLVGITSITKELNNLNGEIQNIELNNIDLEKAVGDLGGVPVKIDLVPKTEDNIKIKSDFELESGASIVGIEDTFNNILSGTSKASELFREEFKKQNTLEIPPIVLTPFEMSQLELKVRIKELNETMSNIMNQGTFDALANLGSAMGNALGSGGNVLEAAGNALLGSLGSIMVKYGKLILAFGLASEGLKAAMKNPFGGGAAAVVAGIALIAIGSAISSFASSTSSGASSSGVSSSGGSGSSNNQVSSNSGFSSGISSGSSGGTVVFEIAGTKLVGILSNTLRRNNSLGGGLGLT